MIELAGRSAPRHTHAMDGVVDGFAVPSRGDRVELSVAANGAVADLKK